MPALEFQLLLQPLYSALRTHPPKVSRLLGKCNVGLCQSTWHACRAPTTMPKHVMWILRGTSDQAVCRSLSDCAMLVSLTKSLSSGLTRRRGARRRPRDPYESLLHTSASPPWTATSPAALFVDFTIADLLEMYRETYTFEQYCRSWHKSYRPHGRVRAVGRFERFLDREGSFSASRSCCALPRRANRLRLRDS